MWGFFEAIGTIIWGAVQTVAELTLEFLVWAYGVLQAFALATAASLVDLARLVARGFVSAWDFLRWTYSNVLKPALSKFWTLVDRVRGALDKLFAPVFAFLRRVRDELLKIYTHFLRPVLDVIDATRAVLKILETLHVAWAQRLDDELSKLEEKIDAPFRFLLEQLNTVINWVNRIATLDGLLQRLALVRSLERDAAYWISTFWKHTVGDVPAPDAAADAAAGVRLHEPPYYGQQLTAYYESGGGEFAELIGELLPIWEQTALQVNA